VSLVMAIRPSYEASEANRRSNQAASANSWLPVVRSDGWDNGGPLAPPARS
jgi:hypothetical protein